MENNKKYCPICGYELVLRDYSYPDNKDCYLSNNEFIDKKKRPNECSLKYYCYECDKYYNKKLFLTSAGFSNKEISDTFLKELGKEPNFSKVFMVASGRTDEENYYIGASKKELMDLGFNDVFVFNLDRQITIDEVKDYDVIYVCGGNTFFILKRFRETGLDKIVVDLVNQGKIYVGVSAGSIMAGPSIEVAASGDENDVNLKDLTGFNFTNIAVFPHFEQERDRQTLEDFRKKVSYPIVEIADNQAVFVDNEEYKIIGKKDV